MEFNEYLKKLRKNKKLTQEQLAEHLNVSRQAITKWESGESIPDIDNLKQIAKFFNTSIDKLVRNNTKENDSLNDKFNYIIFFSIGLGIVLWIVSKNFEFGFLVTVLLPSIIYLIKKLALDYKYNNANDIVNEKDNLNDLLPVNFYGKKLNTNLTKEAKQERKKSYLYESLLFACVFTLIDVVSTKFNNSLEITTKLFNNDNLNQIFSYGFSFILFLIISYIIDYLWYEYIIKKFNK